MVAAWCTNQGHHHFYSIKPSKVYSKPLHAYMWQWERWVKMNFNFITSSNRILHSAVTRYSIDTNSLLVFEHFQMPTVCVQQVICCNINGLPGAYIIYTLWLRQNGRYFADNNFLNENVRISIKISLKFVPINSFQSLFQIMAWRRPGDKPLSQSMMLWLLTHMHMRRSASMS